MQDARRSIAILDDLEEALISADVGVETTVRIIERIETRIAREKYVSEEELQRVIQEEVIGLLEEGAEDGRRDRGLGDDERGGGGAMQFSSAPKPYVIMVVGVNGVGKTTTIGKLASRFANEGKLVWIGAADTFRAAAIDQLEVWAERSGATLVKQQMGSDPASVAFDTLKSAVAGGADVVLIDTAGRLHNKVGLMNELSKIRNVMDRVVAGAPHEVLLVLDGSTGQNAFEQTRQFTAATQVNSLAITKLDGTARGGVVIGISDQFKVPVRWIGVGEGVEDLRPFDKRKFVEELLG